MPTHAPPALQAQTVPAADPVWRCVARFHAHVYFDHAVPARAALARAFRDRMVRAFAANGRVEVQRLVPLPAGPHPCGSFEVRFSRADCAGVLLWLVFERPAGLDVLVHPLTGAQVLDHTERALWLGTPRALHRAPLEAADAVGRGGPMR